MSGQSQYNNLNKITQGIVCLDKPLQMFFIGEAKDGGWNISSRASNFSINMKFSKSIFDGAEFDEGSSKGAFRHALWQAMITVTFGHTTAKEAGWAHDPNLFATRNSGPFNNLESADKYADLMNNKIGRRVGLSHPFSSYKKLAGYVLDEYRNNGLYTVSLGNDGYYYTKQIRLSDQEYIKSKEILEKLNNRGLYK